MDFVVFISNSFDALLVAMSLTYTNILSILELLMTIGVLNDLLKQRLIFLFKVCSDLFNLNAVITSRIKIQLYLL